VKSSAPNAAAIILDLPTYNISFKFANDSVDSIYGINFS
jgi:hypothetical protein